MDGKENRPKYVVTVLRDNKPIAVLEQQRVSDDACTVEGFYQDIDALTEAREIINAVSNSVGYLLWKETGVLPSPPGYLDPTDATDLPF